MANDNNQTTSPTATSRIAAPAAPQRRPSLYRRLMNFMSHTPGGGKPDGSREVVETIVFVIVLVLLLKTFVAEAFVIPTGSMAETLLGYQKWVKCAQCGYEFPVNCSSEVDPQQGGGRQDVTACTCPNCRYKE